MRIGILGSGLMGGKLGTLFAQAGHDVVFSYARTDRKLKRLAREAHGDARAGTPADAARDADAVLLAVHWSRVNDVLKRAGDLSGKTIVTCTLPMNAADTALVIANSSSGAEELAKRVPTAHVVAAFSTVPSEVLFSVFDAEPCSLLIAQLAYEGEAGPGDRVSLRAICRQMRPCHRRRLACRIWPTRLPWDSKR